MLIGEKLRQRRKERGLSQEQAANLYYSMRPDKPIGRKAISNWENDVSKPNLDDLEILCAIYHCSLPQILDYDFTPPIMHYLEYRRLTDSEKAVHDIILKDFHGDFSALVHAVGMYAALSNYSRRSVIKALIDEYEYCKEHKLLKYKLPVSAEIVKKSYDKRLKHPKD